MTVSTALPQLFADTEVVAGATPGVSSSHRSAVEKRALVTTKETRPYGDETNDLMTCRLGSGMQRST